MLVRIRQLSSSSPLPTGVITAPPAPELSPPAFASALLPPELAPAVLVPPEPRPAVCSPPAPAVLSPPAVLLAPPVAAAPMGAIPPVALVSPPAPPFGATPPEPLLPHPHERTSDSVTAAELRPILATMTTSLRQGGPILTENPSRTA